MSLQRARAAAVLLATTAAVGGVATTAAPTAHADELFTSRRTAGLIALTDSTGTVWSRAAGFTGGTRTVLPTTTSIASTADAAIYRTVRAGVPGYSVPVPRPGSYDVTLKMVEPGWQTSGKRVFDVLAEGGTVVDDLDLVAAGGRQVAVDRTVRVEVTDGRLDLGFRASVGKPVVSAIAVTEVSPIVVPPDSAPSWRSGCSCSGAADGTFGTWRGRPLDLISTWSDNDRDSRWFWPLQPGGELASWKGDLDVSVGAIDPGKSWQQAAQGTEDDRWRASLTELASLRSTAAGATYVRFAHEMNGNWYPWSVNATNASDFVTAWKRYRAIQKEVFPAAKLVFSVNRESFGWGIDWRTTFPGAASVDVLSVDYYNQYPSVSTVDGWNASVNSVDAYGAPKGLAKHLEFADSQGFPLAVSEWSGVADQGDSPVFVQQMQDFFAVHGGRGPGQLLNDSLFNCNGPDPDWQLFPTNRLVTSAAAYRLAFSTSAESAPPLLAQHSVVDERKNRGSKR